MPPTRDEDRITVSISILSQMVRYLSHLKADITGIFRAAGVDPDILNRPDRRLPVSRYIAIEDEAARVTGDPCFGLHMGEFFEPGHWSILGYMMMNCRTLGEAYEKMDRYYKVIGNLFGCRIQAGLGKLTIVLDVPRHTLRLSRHYFECSFASSVRMIRTLTGRDYRPREVGFSHPAPASRAEYDRVFGCPVRFGRKHNSLTVHPEIVRWPVLLPNRRLLAHFESYANEYLAGIETPERTSGAVIRIILAKLDDRSLSLRSVAREMGMSPRTLQGRLKEEGVIFRNLLRTTRERLAKKYLRENYTVEDITYLLGFAEASVFRKAFKKWTGRTPAEFRKSAVNAYPARRGPAITRS